MVSHMLVSTVPYISTILPVGTLVLRLFHTLNYYHKQLCTSITSHIFVKRSSASLLAFLDALVKAIVSRLLLQVLVPKKRSALTREDTGNPVHLLL